MPFDRIMANDGGPYEAAHMWQGSAYGRLVITMQVLVRKICAMQVTEDNDSVSECPDLMGWVSWGR